MFCSLLVFGLCNAVAFAHSHSFDFHFHTVVIHVLSSVMDPMSFILCIFVDACKI